MNQTQKSAPRLEIEEFSTGILLIHKIFGSSKLRVNAPITKPQLQILINYGWHVIRKNPTSRGMKKRAQSMSYRHPISDSEISDAVEEEAKE